MGLRLFLSGCLLLCLTTALTAQQAGYISGFVRDRSGAGMPGAEIRLQNTGTGSQSKTYTDAASHYESEGLLPGIYTLSARMPGFYTVTRTGIVVSGNRARQVDFAIELLPLQQEISVEASGDESNPSATGLALKRGDFTNAFPANGRDLRAFINLMPGVTTTPAAIGDGGQFSVGGQRPNTNSFRIDGISGNVGIGVISVPGSFPGGSLPGMSTIGSTQTLVSKDEIKRIDLNSSNFAADAGDRPGAQISVETRSGSNEFHGSAFGYLRPQALNSKDWFSQSSGASLPASKWSGWSGSAAGPVWRNRLYFFGAYERATLLDNAVKLLAIPSPAARSRMSPTYQQLVDSFAVARGSALTPDYSVGISGINKAATVSNRSIRLDAPITNHVQLFARYSSVPSSSNSYELGAASSRFDWLSATGGIVISTTRTLQQIRLNYSNALAIAKHGGNAFSENPALGVVNNVLQKYLSPLGPQISAGTNVSTCCLLSWNVTQLSLAGVAQTLSGASGQSYQRQQEISDTFSVTLGSHELSLGGDFVRLIPRSGNQYGTLSINSGGVPGLLAGDPLGLTISSNSNGVDAARISSFAQDRFRVNQRLNIIYGLRWEFIPPVAPYTIAGNPLSYIGAWSDNTSPPSLIGSSNRQSRRTWPFRLNQFAPRLGVAYQLPRSNIVLRSGFGLFYDTNLGSTVNPINGSDLGSWTYYPGYQVPASAVVDTASQFLSLPRVTQWRTALEKALPFSSLVSVAYFGASGRRLPRRRASVDPSTGVLQSLSYSTDSRSDYHSLQAQIRGQLTPRLAGLVSYTWAHSIDTGSSDTATFLNRAGANELTNRASSSYDVRHNIMASASYRLPSGSRQLFLNSFLRDWVLSGTMLARSGFPIDVSTVDRTVGMGFDNTDRPDLVPNQPLWLADSNVPGGRRLNPAAFAAPAPGMDGSLGRNALAGPGLFQVDAGLKRQFHLREKIGLDMQISAFNLTNHPNFSNPNTYLSSPLFGQSTSMGNLMLGAGSPTTGLTPLFQSGGPRTVELGMRLSF